MLTALICSLLEVDPAHRTEFLAFHTREHLPERMSVPGFCSGRRFVSAANRNRFLIVYEVETLAVLQSAAYVERLNQPTDWTRRCMAFVRGNDRMAIQLQRVIGAGHGGHARLLHDGHQAADAIAAMPGIVAVRTGWISPEASDMDSVERRVLGGGDHQRAPLMLVEAIDAGKLCGVDKKTASPGAEDAVFQLQFALTR